MSTFLGHLLRLRSGYTSALRQRPGSHAIATVAVLVAGMSAACAGDTAFSPSSDAHILLRSVKLSEHTYNMATMAPYDTAQLHVTATMADGTPAPAAVQYATSDSALFIDPSGMLHVRSALTRSSVAAIVYASVTVSGVTQRDSAFVHVVTTQPRIPARFAIADTDVYLGIPWSVPRVMAWPNIGYVGLGRIYVVDSTGTPETILTHAYSSDSTVVKVLDHPPLGGIDLDLFYVNPVAPGHAWMYVSAYVYGKILRDSMAIVIGRSQLYVITTSADQQMVDGVVERTLRFHPDSLNVPAGADISWIAPPECFPLSSGDGACRGTFINIDFDQPEYALASRIPPAYGTTPDIFGSVYNSNADIMRLFYNLVGGTGNIASFGVMNPGANGTCSDVVPINCREAMADGATGGEARRFVTPGHYHYHTVQGASGVIVVE